MKNGSNAILPRRPARDAHERAGDEGDDRHSARRAPGAGTETIERRAQLLFASLPDTQQLAFTRQRFPHVLNRIAAEWEAPERFLRLLDELLIDQRGKRRGFPFETVIELTHLREYYLERMEPLPTLPAHRDPDIWR